ncbi:unnamed protein product [Rhizoctonia solani]|uniref:F-box domain-containing protein n=1 Tax=Rhizoctonia solani TaxID=456999 RepID=A0A8H3D378_9AGAM|nr:unnamed protein product [Rhizoctonia solani]
MHALEKWESISAQFENVLTAYLDACILVDSCAVERPVNLLKVLPRLELGIDSLGNRLMQQLIVSRLHLTRARNKLATTVHHLPEEILANIFSNVIYDSAVNKSHPIEKCIRATYRRLHALVSVCTDWRKIGLSHSAFWSLIPFLWTEPQKCVYDAMNLSLDRAGSSGLYLAGTTGQNPNRGLLDFVAEHGPRFCAINFYGEAPGALRAIIINALKYSRPGHLTTLSVRCQARDNLRASDLTRPSENLFLPNSEEHIQVQYFASLLHTLRLSGLGLDWHTIQLSSLVELRVQEVSLADISTAGSLLLAAASAPGLRSLQLIAVNVHPESTSLLRTDWEPRVTVSLPFLQSLYLQDLYMGLLQLILRSISPGLYKVAITNTLYQCFDPHMIEDTIDPGLESLEFPDRNIHTLTLNSILYVEPDFFLKAMPTIKTLYIHTQKYPRSFRSTLEALVRPAGIIRTDTYAKLDVLYISGPLIHIFEESDLAIFKKVITSHGIQELGLRGPLAVQNMHMSDYSSVLFDNPNGGRYTAHILEWLKDNVPKVIFLNLQEDLPEPASRMDSWQLW